MNKVFLIWLIFKYKYPDYIKIIVLILSIYELIFIYYWRISYNLHWFSDCVFGMLIGLIFSIININFYKVI